MPDDPTVVTPSPSRQDDDATRVLPGMQHGPVTPVPRALGHYLPPQPPVADTPTEARGLTQTLPGSPTATAPAVRQVGRYLIQERLGRGGMATVFKAHDPGIGRDVAIKFLHATLCEDAEYRGRFLREARAAGGLSHPNIVTVHDVGEIEGRPYMAMELLHGEPLSDLMESGKPLPVRDVVIMGIQLARALDYAHAHGIVHRDIKPGNIVRLRGTHTIKVTDFGIAHMETTGTGEQRTRVGDVLGTPQYMSPEQTQGEKLDGRSDLFSVGIMLYQMLTGQRPFQADSLVALAMKIAHEEPPAIEKLRPDLPHALRRIVERCLAKPRDRRFQTGRELSDALSRVLADLDEAARAKERPRIVPLRVKWAAMMALVVAVVMALSATVITQRQYGAMLKQVTDNGASLARFIAAQNAVLALSEEWPTVDVAVQEMMKTGDFQSITVVDREGIVRAAGDPALVGQPYKGVPAEALGTRDGGVVMSRYSAMGEPVLGFEAPITFQGKGVGRVALGLPERPLVHVARLSMALMAALVVVTVLAVAIAMYFVANWFAQPIKLVNEAMGEIAKGRFDHRIAEQRNDEFGLLFSAFDRMAQALQDARSGAGPSPATPAPLRDPSTPTVAATMPLPRETPDAPADSLSDTPAAGAAADDGAAPSKPPA
ncbi:protein kinase [Piscinibacter sp. XHJ-5]|uniref:protein kinase domain-containing protein n=1 Tax=Piscinibacter sp. XHJ-5 TaxID=3037797 RepID=UPI00245336FE|nr:protein kinase [Piscinibacter sp. XHJ-5]